MWQPDWKRGIAKDILDDIYNLPNYYSALMSKSINNDLRVKISVSILVYAR